MKRKFKTTLIILLVLFLSLGFAVLTSNLNIKGNFSFLENSFSVYLDKLVIVNSILESPSVNIDNKESLSLTGNFKKPGDYIEFSFYAINNGTIDAELNNIEITGIDTSVDSYFTKSIKNSDGTEILKGAYLQAGSARKLIVKIEYKYDIENFVSIENLVININVSYIQAKSSNIDSWNYEYIDQEQYFITPKTGTYKLEVWGAQGGTSYQVISDGGTFNGNPAGYGGYSTGTVSLHKHNKIYLNVGGQGYKMNGGYNGGGSGSVGGGGATHIALKSGQLSSLGDSVSSILLIAGGGGGSEWGGNATPSGGGYKGGNGSQDKYRNYVNPNNIDATGGSQSSGGIGGTGYHPTTKSLYKATNGIFGRGGYGHNYIIVEAGTGDPVDRGPGGGLYGGGGAAFTGQGAGGSGYIGNPLLESKSMYCYECEESSEETTKTISTTNVSEIATSQYAKKGNGYVKITYLS